MRVPEGTRHSGGGDVQWGWVCATVGCDDHLFIQPEGQSHGEGYQAQPVIGGPNNGIWYVHSASFGMPLASAYNETILPTYSPRFQLPADQADSCRAPLGVPPGDPVFVNFWEYNRHCEGNTKFASLLDSLEMHESSHNSFAQEDAATQDPMIAVEALTRDSLADITAAVAAAVSSRATHIESTAATSVHGVLTFWSSYIFTWDFVLDRFKGWGTFTF